MKRDIRTTLSATGARLHYQLMRLGWPGGLGVVLLLTALAADPLIHAPLEEQVANARAAAAHRALLPRRDEPRKALRVVPRERVESALPRLFEAARHHGLDLDEARYAETGDQPGIRSATLRIDLPVAGTYPALRAFLAELLDDNPALGLDSLELTRESIEDNQLEARLRLRLNLEQTP